MPHVISNPSAECIQSRNERIRGIYKYWDSKRQGRRMPSTTDMDPVEIPEYLSNVILVDVFYEPLWFRYRLVGTDSVKNRGFDPTGGWIGGNLPWKRQPFRDRIFSRDCRKALCAVCGLSFCRTARLVCLLRPDHDAAFERQRHRQHGFHLRALEGCAGSGFGSGRRTLV